MKNKEITIVKVAIGTMLFMNTVMPIIDSLTSFVITTINQFTNRIQIDMQLDQASAEVQANKIGGADCTRAIGFEIPSEPMEDYDE